jgi:antitoxin HicB
MRDKSVRKADLARRLHARQTTVDRLLDIRHASRLDQLDEALAVLGKRLDIRVRNAPSEPRGQS